MKGHVENLSANENQNKNGTSKKAKSEIQDRLVANK